MIQNAVKKALLPLEKSKGLRVIGTDQGTIDEEEYEIVITTPSAIFEHSAIEVIFFVNFRLIFPKLELS